MWLIEAAVNHNMEIVEPFPDEENFMCEENIEKTLEKCVGSDVAYIDKSIGEHVYNMSRLLEPSIIRLIFCQNILRSTLHQNKN